MLPFPQCNILVWVKIKKFLSVTPLCSRNTFPQSEPAAGGEQTLQLESHHVPQRIKQIADVLHEVPAGQELNFKLIHQLKVKSRPAQERG